MQQTRWGAPPPDERSKRWWILGIIAVVVVLGGWAAYELISAARAASDFQSHLKGLKDKAGAQDVPAVAAGLPALRTSAENFDAAADRPVLTLGSALPILGSTFSSVRSLAAASLEMANATSGLDRVLPELAPDELYKNGAVDLKAVQDLTPELRRLAAAAASADNLARQADPGAIGPVGEAVRQAQEQLSGLAGGLSTGTKVAEILPSLLGANGTRRWAIILENGSEARGTGGFPGAYALAQAENGKLRVRQIDTNNSLKTPIPNRQMPREFLDLWTERYTSDWLTYNLSRHFPYTGELTRSGMAARKNPVDDVLAMDAHAVAALLAGTGPVSARGVTVDSSNAERFFNSEIYTRFPNVKEKDAAVVAIMTAVLNRAMSGSLDVPAMIKAFVPVVEQGRLLVWSSRKRTQATLASWPVGGIVPDTRGAWTAVDLNNSSASKLDAFIESSVRYEAATCGSGTSSVHVTLTNKAPTGLSPYAEGSLPGQPKGTTSLFTSVYGPVGAVYQEATLDGEVQFVRQGFERGHPVWGGYDIILRRGQTRELVVKFTEPVSSGTPIVYAQAMPITQVVQAEKIPCGTS